MSDDGILVSAVRESGDLAGVFEADEEISYFYLYDTQAEDGGKVVDAIQIVAGKPDFREDEVLVRWDDRQEKVGLFIRGYFCAVFDATTRTKYGGNYRRDAMPSLPPTATDGF